MSNEPAPLGEIVLYQTDEGRIRVECRFADETLWLSQSLIAKLFQVSLPTVNEHLKEIYAEGELPTEANYSEIPNSSPGRHARGRSSHRALQPRCHPRCPRSDREHTARERENSRREAAETVTQTYAAPGRCTIAVKVIDIFVNDTMTLVPITVGKVDQP